MALFDFITDNFRRKKDELVNSRFNVVNQARSTIALARPKIQQGYQQLKVQAPQAASRVVSTIGRQPLPVPFLSGQIKRPTIGQTYKTISGYDSNQAPSISKFFTQQQLNPQEKQAFKGWTTNVAANIGGGTTKLNTPKNLRRAYLSFEQNFSTSLGKLGKQYSKQELDNAITALAKLPAKAADDIYVANAKKAAKFIDVAKRNIVVSAPFGLSSSSIRDKSTKSLPVKGAQGVTPILSEQKAGLNLGDVKQVNDFLKIKGVVIEGAGTDKAVIRVPKQVMDTLGLNKNGFVLKGNNYEIQRPGAVFNIHGDKTTLAQAIQAKEANIAERTANQKIGAGMTPEQARANFQQEWQKTYGNRPATVNAPSQLQQRKLAGKPLIDPPLGTQGGVLTDLEKGLIEDYPRKLGASEWNVLSQKLPPKEISKLQVEIENAYRKQGGRLPIQKGIEDISSQPLPLGQKPSALVGQATKQPLEIKPSQPIQISSGGGQSNVPGSTSSPDSISDPVNKIIQALKEAKPIRKEQEALYSAERAKRFAKASAMGQKVPGEQGYFAQLGSLKGELPKAQFEGIRSKLTSNDVNTVFQKVEDIPYFSVTEKITAKTGLAKLLGQEGGSVPNNSELKLLNEVFPPEFIRAAMGNRTGIQKLMGLVGDIAGVPRSIMAGGLDMSYGLRQGVFSGYRHPAQWASSFKEQFKYFGSEKAILAAENARKAHPNYKLAREAGVAFTDMGSGKLTPREEVFQSQLAEKIPGVKYFVKASGRAYTGFANKYRFDMFNDLVTQAKKTGDFADPKFLKSAGELVNTLTGRGSLGPLEKAAGPLSTTLFSPRLLASRLQLMNPQFYMKLQPLARKRALESLVAYVAGTGTILGAAKLAGADVGTDPTSSDFAKIKVGNTRVDIMGGFQQPVVLLARLLTGKMTSSTTGKTMILGEGYKTANRFDIIQRFFESKEAPIVSFIVSAMKGKDAVGNDFNLPTEVIDRMVPMFISDLVDLYKDGGLSSLPLGVPAFFGAGAQTYGKTEAVQGVNQLGEPTSQIRPIQGLGATISTKLFGQAPLGSSSSTNVGTYYDQLLKLPKSEAAAKFDEIAKTNPDLAKKIVQEVKDRKKGVTVDDEVLKAKGVASGDRAVALIKEFNKLETKEEKIALWDRYVKLGIITKDVAKQLQGRLNQ